MRRQKSKSKEPPKFSSSSDLWEYKIYICLQLFSSIVCLVWKQAYFWFSKLWRCVTLCCFSFLFVEKCTFISGFIAFLEAKVLGSASVNAYLFITNNIRLVSGPGCSKDSLNISGYSCSKARTETLSTG